MLSTGGFPTTSSPPPLGRELCHHFCALEPDFCFTGPGFQRFQAADLASCQQYCLLTEPCKKFSFNILTLLCTLFSNSNNLSRGGKVYAPQDKFLVAGARKCLDLNLACRDKEELLAAGEVLIRSRRLGKCLSIRFRESRLVWVKCTKAVTWQLEQVGMGEWQQESAGEQKLVKISARRRPGQCCECCLSLDRMGRQHLGCARSCSSREETQVLKLAQSGMWMEDSCFYTLFRYHESLISHPTRLGIGGVEMQFLLPGDNRGPCSKEQLERRGAMVVSQGGTVVGDQGAPFILPNTNVTLRCQEGFTFMTQNPVRELQVLCRDANTRPPDCVKLQQREDEGLVMRVLAAGNGLQGCIILYLLMLLLALRRTRSRDRALRQAAGDGTAKGINGHYPISSTSNQLSNEL